VAGKATQAPLNCPEPDCAGKDCKTKVGGDGCLVCECGTSCPTLVCGPGCHPEANVTQDRCPECTCDGDPSVSGHVNGGDRHCPEVQCPADCEKEQVIPPHRCPWCLCHPITARKTLEKFGERHCPRELMEMVLRQADGLFKHTEALREQLHHQDIATRRLEGNQTGGATWEMGAKICPAPGCAGQHCSMVPGVDGCPVCQCEPACPALACGPSCQEEANVSHGRYGGVEEATTTAPSLTRDSVASRPRSRRDHHLGHHGNDSHPAVGSDGDHTGDALDVTSRVQRTYILLQPEPIVQCVVPICEPYCKTRPAEHGCLVCDCPDVCPDIVCGAGCQPYFTETSRCERCVCNPHARREQMADVFASYCSEPTLHRMIADFGALERLVHDLQQRSFQHQQVISRAEQTRGIHGTSC
ncbi:unnamed protein product, partial [Ixodes hexagonus]